MHNDIAIQPAYSNVASKLLARQPQLFIDGRWVDPVSGDRIRVYDPSTGRQVSEIADAGQADVDAAVGAARRAFDDGRWTGLPPIAREMLIHRLADIMQAHADELAELEAIDNGKPRSIADQVDIPAAIGMLHYMAVWATKHGGETIDPLAAPTGAFHAYTRREPIGVAAQIVPQNRPRVTPSVPGSRMLCHAVPARATPAFANPNIGNTT